MAFVLIRNPKTGGTSVCNTLIEKADAWRVPAAERCRLPEFKLGLLRHKIVVCEPEAGRRFWGGLTPEERRQHTWVGFMRNPWERFISGWQYSMQMRWLPKDSDPVKLLQELPAAPWRVWLHCLRHQVRSLYDDAENKIPSIVLSTENLTEDYNRLLVRMELPEKVRRVALPALNTTDYLPWRSYYREHKKLRKLLEDRLDWDFATLPYTYAQDGPTGLLPARMGEM